MAGPNTPDPALADAAAALDKQLLAFDEALAAQFFDASSSDDTIAARASGAGDLVSLTLSAELLTPAAGPGLSAALIPVLNAVLAKWQAKARADLASLVAGFLLPGFPADPPDFPAIPAFGETVSIFRRQMDALEAAAATASYVGRAADGKVEVEVNGLLEVTAITLDPSLLSSVDASATADFIQHAVKLALRTARHDVACQETDAAAAAVARGRVPLGAIWEHKPNAGSPTGFIYPMGGWDPILGAPLVFGGYAGPNFSIHVNDIFLYRNGQWDLIEPTTAKPPGGCCSGMVFDTQREVWWLYGGPGPAGGTQGNMWSFNPRTLAWTEIPRATGWAPHLLEEQVTFDTVRGQLLYPAARDTASTVTEIWEWNGSSWNNPKPASPPSWRYQPIIGFDQARAQMVMFGGRGRSDPSVPPWNANIPFAETWTWDGVSWMQRHSEHSPPARWAGSMTYDSDRRRLVMYGARQSTTDDPFTTWEWDGNDWYPMTTSLGPYEGYGVRLAYDPSRRRIVAYGYGETAEYYVSGG